MSDASPIDPAAVRRRVFEIKQKLFDEGNLGTEDACYLIDQLRTALADTRRVDLYEALYKAACDWFNYGPPHMIDETDPGSIVTSEGDYEPMTKALEDAVSAIDDAMAATPREANHEN